MSWLGRVIDSVVADIAPKAGAKRAAARSSYHQIRRYDAGSRGRQRDDWNASTASADALIERDVAIVRARMRDLVRNNSMAAKAVQVLVNNMVGTGIRPRASSGNKALNRRVDRLFAEWSKQCDAEGLADFYGMQALAVREMIEGGDLFAVRRSQNADSKLPVPVQVELREAEFLDTSKLTDTNAYRIDQGIEFDESGRRSALWMFDEHPGGRLTLRGSTLSRRLPLEQVAHLFERQRKQNRGMPWGTPAMTDLRDHGDYRRAEMVRKKTEACLVGIVMTDDEDQESLAPLVTRSDGTTVESFEPGMIAYARGGKDIKMNTPAAAGGIYEWNSVQAHDIASGFRLPYELLTGDLRQVNFSSSRIGLNEFRRMIEMMQWLVVIPMFCDRLWDWFTQAAYQAGKIPNPTVPVEWAPPRFESVNPLQDAQADILEVRAGFSTTAQKIAERGYEPREIIEEQAAFNGEADAAGLVFDTDPRNMTKSGGTQAAGLDREPPPSEETET